MFMKILLFCSNVVFLVIYALLGVKPMNMKLYWCTFYNIYNIWILTTGDFRFDWTQLQKPTPH